MGTRKLSFGLLLVLTCVAVAILLLVAACQSDTESETQRVWPEWEGKGDMPREAAMEYLQETWPCAEAYDFPESQLHKVWYDNGNLIFRDPHILAYDYGSLKYADGTRIADTGGLQFLVCGETDQSLKPKEDRIPNCVQGVPVQIIKHKPVVFIADAPNRGE